MNDKSYDSEKKCDVNSQTDNREDSFESGLEELHGISREAKLSSDESRPWVSRQKQELLEAGDGPVPKRMGRCCFTCRYRKSRTGHFISCKHHKLRKIWDKASCTNWRYTRKDKILCQVSHFLAEDFMDFLLDPLRQNLVKNPQIRLGRCCFTCKFRGPRNGHFVFCTKEEQQVWDKARCARWTLMDKHDVLSQFKKFMNRAGWTQRGCGGFREMLQSLSATPANHFRLPWIQRHFPVELPPCK